MNTEDIIQRAREGIMQGVTSHGVRDFSALTTWVGYFLNEGELAHLEENHEELIDDLISDAVRDAEQFYRDEAGGAHDLPDMTGWASWDILAELPLDSTSKMTYQINDEFGNYVAGPFEDINDAHRETDALEEMNPDLSYFVRTASNTWVTPVEWDNEEETPLETIERLTEELEDAYATIRSLNKINYERRDKLRAVLAALRS